MTGYQSNSSRSGVRIQRFWVGVAIPTVAAVGAIVAAVWSGNVQLAADKEEFLRDQRLIAFADFTADTLAFDDTYGEALGLVVAVHEDQPPPTTALPAELEAAMSEQMDGMRQSLALVDIVSSDAVRSSADATVQMYSEMMSEMVDYLRAIEQDVAFPGHPANMVFGLIAEAETSREAFLENARQDLKIP